jgi:protein-glutamine gamma-glutamyltransferase
VVSGTFSPPAAAAREGSAERFFQWSLYLLLVTGFCTLMGTGKLDLPSLALMIPALLLRGYALLMRSKFFLPERWTTYLTLLYLPFYAADYFYLSQSFMSATVHLVLFSLVMKIFSVRRDRDLVYLTVLSFGLVLFAVVLTVDTLFLLTFALFILAAMATFISLEMRRSERESVAAPVAPRDDARFYRALAGVSAALGVLTLGGAALIFFVLPRLNSVGYLRNLGMQSAISTGFGQEVQLGGIGQIQQSDAVVMHVQVLEGRLPADPKWRGLTLANFDGKRWWNGPEALTRHALKNGWLDLSQVAAADFSGEARARRLPTFRYRVIMEPVGLNLFFLAPAAMNLSGNYRILETASDGSVYNTLSDDSGQNMGVYTAVADVRDPESLVRDSSSRDYPSRISRVYLQLPSLDPRIPELAQRVAAPAGPSNYARARAVESYLKSNLGYTLELPGHVADPLAHFLFTRRKGHCEYFASSMTVMLRVLGIPARVVNGFRGGEYNDLTGRYIVREKDAHSWVEAYFPEYGWVTFDPTPAGTTAPAAGSWARVALYLDAARDMWREWIVNYDFSHQVRLSNQISATTSKVQFSLRGWLRAQYRAMVRRSGRWQQRLQQMSPGSQALLFGLLALLLALPFVPKVWRGVRRARLLRDPSRAPRSAASFWYLRLLKRLARAGLRKTPAQTPEEFASSIADPQMRKDVVTFTEHYERARFADSVDDAQRLPELYEEIVGKG